MCKRLRQPNSTKPSVSIESMTSLLGSYGSDSCADLSELPGYLARELHRLQPQAQSKVFEDLVGISQKHHEENVMERIAELQLAISQRSLNREAYEAAVSASPKYVSSQLLSFLRAEDFNPKAAARRVMSHFQKKLELFGLDSLVKDISLQDLDEDDTEALACGGIQFLPSKDRAGRPVFVRQYSNMKYKKRINMLRAIWYMLHKAVQDEEAQKNGLILVDYDVGRLPMDRYDENSNVEIVGGDADGGFDSDLCHQIVNLIRSSVAIRVMGVHLCFNSDQWQRIHDLTIVWFGKTIRLRVKRHEGSHRECRYNLLCHGIPALEIPVSLDGELTVANHLKWCENQRQLEKV